MSLNRLNILSFTLISFFILGSIAALCFTCLLVVNSYHEFVMMVLGYYNKMERLDDFKSIYLTENRFFLLRVVSIFVSIFFLASLMFRKKVLSFVLPFIDKSLLAIHFALTYLVAPFKNLSARERLLSIFLLVFITGMKLFFLPRYFFHIDEITSYLFFIKKGFFVIMSYYPNPNNHILYLLFTKCFEPFIQNPVYLLKVPALVLGTVLTIVAFLYFLRVFPFNLSLFGILLFSFAGHIFNYSLFGRGYILMELFVVLQLFCLVTILQTNDNRFWYLYMFVSAAGFYTMILFIYPFVSGMIIFILFYWEGKKYIELKNTFFIHGVIVVLVLILYTPLFIVSGLNALIANPWIVTLDFKLFILKIPSFIDEAFMHILDFDYYAKYIGCTLLVLASFVLWKSKQRIPFYVLVIYFMVPLVLITIQRTVPYNRMWTYLIFPTALAILYLMDFILLKIRNEKFKNVFLLSVGIVFSYYTFDNSIKNTSPERQLIYTDVYKICSQVVKDCNGKIYTNENTYNLYLRYTSDLSGNPIEPSMDKIDPATAYSHLLLIPGTPFPEGIMHANYALVQKNPYIEVYRLKQ